MQKELADGNHRERLRLEHSSDGLIANTEGLRGEPLLTQWLAYVLRQPAYQPQLLAFFAGGGIVRKTLPKFSIRDEIVDRDGDGTPDIEISGENLALIVENKFDARLTTQQPVGYIKILERKIASKKILVFLVPAWREREIRAILAPYIRKSRIVTIRVCKWEELAELLISSIGHSELVHEFARDVLRRCKVKSPLKREELLDASHVLSQWLTQQELLKEIHDLLRQEPLFKGMKLQLETKPEWDADHCYMGVNVTVSGTTLESEWLCWIGFWNLFQRKTPSATPLIAHVHATAAAKKRLRKFWSSLSSLRAANVVSSFVPGHGWPIPIPISIVRKSKSVRGQAEAIVAYAVRVFNGDRNVKTRFQDATRNS